MVKRNISPIGLFLRKLRFDHNESQEDMAQKLGVSTPYISLIEGRQAITKKIAVKIISEYKLTGAVKDDFVNIVTQDIINRFWGK